MRQYPKTQISPMQSKGSATIFSLIQSAYENSLDPYRYLTWLLKAANNADLDDPKIVQSLFAWERSGRVQNQVNMTSPAPMNGRVL